MTLRVLMLATDYPPDVIGGIGLHTHHLAHHLVGAGIRCTLAVPGDVPSPTVRIDEGLRLVLAPRIPVTSVFNVQNLVGVMRQNVELCEAVRSTVDPGGFDLVHAQDFFPGPAAIALARSLQCPLVLTKHFVPMEPDGPEKALTLAEIARIEQQVARTASAWIGVSTHTLEYLRRIVPGGARAQRLIENGAEPPPPPQTSPEEWRARHGFDERPLVVLVGAVSRRKGGEQLLRAIASLAVDRRPSLVFVGRGPNEGVFAELAGALGLASCTFFAGHQERTGVHAWLRCADVVAVPSLEEALPLSLLEAMAHGRAVVASRVGQIPAVLHDGENGLSVAPGDVPGLATALERLVLDPALRERLGNRAQRDMNQRFSWSGAARSTAELYRELGPLHGAVTHAHAQPSRPDQGDQL